ncbi:MAG TPA: metal-dependent hydrolase [Myxococcaceae bacterium]|nr:metal-dependent hydrolase [Myxococcaceae bacterium]
MTAPSSVTRAPVLTRGAPAVFVQPMARFEPRPLDPEHIRPRRTAFSFPGSIARHWLAGSPVRTHFFNAINLFVVSFEDFMARVMRGCLPGLQDAEFARQIRGFMGQESTHSFVHAKYLQNMREQGFDIDGYLSGSEHIFSHWFEKRLGQRVSVAMIAGFEHLTSVLAELILDGRMVRDAEPAMAEMWEWHAAEEIEHKTLAFELLQRTSGSYLLRLVGAVLGALVVAGFIGVGMVMLLRQEGLLWRKSTWKELRTLLFGKDRLVVRTVRMFMDYFRPGFHPNQRDTYALAQEVFDRQASQRGA